MRTLIVTLAVLVGLVPTSATASSTASSTTDCVTGREWNVGIADLSDPDGAARRPVIEAAWGVEPVGHRNEFYAPANPRLYSVAYAFCGGEQKVVMVYRKSSESWQIAFKGAILSLDN